MENVFCPYCRKRAEFVSSAAVYGRCYGMIYLCKPCDAYVGVHQGTEKPKGTLAKKELRELRKQAHAVFDPLWKRKLELRRVQRGPEYKTIWARMSGYKWLSKNLGIPMKQCHIGMMDEEQCRAVIHFCKHWRSYENR